MWSVNKTAHILPIQLISDQLKVSGYSGIGKVYPILGNHEGLPCDSFDVYNKGHQWILDNVTEIWSDWFTEKCKCLI